MNWYKIAKKVQPKDNNFSWVRLNLPEEIVEVHAMVTKEIDKDDLYLEWQNKKDWEKGIEDDPHITVKYGLESDDPDKVIEVLKKEKGGKVELKKAKIFKEKEDYDVLVVECESDALQKIHDKLTDELQIPDSYPYIPHITIAYFKKGKAKRYEAMVHKAFTYYLLEFNFDEITFEDPGDNQTKIKLD